MAGERNPSTIVAAVSATEYPMRWTAATPFLVKLTKRLCIEAGFLYSASCTGCVEVCLVSRRVPTKSGSSFWGLSPRNRALSLHQLCWCLEGGSPFRVFRRTSVNSFEHRVMCCLKNVASSLLAFSWTSKTDFPWAAISGLCCVMVLEVNELVASQSQSAIRRAQYLSQNGYLSIYLSI